MGFMNRVGRFLGGMVKPGSAAARGGSVAEALASRAGGASAFQEGLKTSEIAWHHNWASGNVRSQVGGMSHSAGLNYGSRATSSLTGEALDRAVYLRGMRQAEQAKANRGSLGSRIRGFGKRVADGAPGVKDSILNGTKSAWDSVKTGVKNFANMSNEQRVAAGTSMLTNAKWDAKEAWVGVKEAFGGLDHNSMADRMMKHVAVGAGLGAGSSILASSIGLGVDDVDGHGFIRSAFKGALLGGAIGATKFGSMTAAKYQGPGGTGVRRAGEAMTSSFANTAMKGALIAGSIAGGTDIKTRSRNPNY